MIDVFYDHQKDELQVLFDSYESVIHVDKAIYPSGEKVINIIKDINYKEKDFSNLLKIKSLIWQLHEILRTHLNRIGNRDKSYTELEVEYKAIKAANYFLFLGINLEAGNMDFISEFLENPILAYN